MKNNSLLYCEDLTIGYKKPVLTGINLEFEAGQFVSLLGPNGTGKTTLLRTLSRHIKPHGGLVMISGRPLADYPPLALARIMAVVLTEKSAPPLLSVLEYVALGRYPHTGFLGRLSRKDLGIVTASLLAVKADELAGRLVDQLSDGEKQKVVLARALAQEPTLMLLDEPTAHLDLKHRVEVMTILRGLCRSQGLTVLAALHDVDMAAKVSDQVILIKNGRLEGYGRPEDILTSEKVSDLYDFSGAGFSHQLGGIEIQGSGRSGRAFVLAGPGRGATIYRLLAKHGFTFAAGFPAESDLDAHVAKALNAEIMYRTDDLVNGQAGPAVNALEKCDFLIDGGGFIDGDDQLRQKIVQAALDRSRPVLALETDEGVILEGCRVCAGMPELIKAIAGLNRADGRREEGL
jgi:ABC-type cobalamin/Fe3+-siderophores transport systems, ATPase components